MTYMFLIGAALFLTGSVILFVLSRRKMKRIHLLGVEIFSCSNHARAIKKNESTAKLVGLILIVLSLLVLFIVIVGHI